MSNRVPSDAAIEARNRTRREKYATDEEYRAAALGRSRDFARENRGTSSLQDCRANLTRLDELGVERNCAFPGEQAQYGFLSFTDKEIAEVLCVSHSTLQKWYMNDVLPRPVITVMIKVNNFGRDELTPIRAYIEPEIRAVMGALGPHQAKLRYVVPSKHFDTIQAIAQAVKDVRDEYDIGYT